MLKTSKSTKFITQLGEGRVVICDDRKAEYDGECKLSGIEIRDNKIEKKD